jgi:hypothetical protein
MNRLQGFLVVFAQPNESNVWVPHQSYEPLLLDCWVLYPFWQVGAQQICCCKDGVQHRLK